ncbi:unnamed protein product [Nezara viridula]|uniref:Uncharacterized protein n=1 Tax=Nezara viridula TaxID=85310 RepID=A0A9P0EE48_NEZVI|nr:unnamed protein product [Nezara viridula]
MGHYLLSIFLGEGARVENGRFIVPGVTYIRSRRWSHNLLQKLNLKWEEQWRNNTPRDPSGAEGGSHPRGERENKKREELIQRGDLNGRGERFE